MDQERYRNSSIPVFPFFHAFFTAVPGTGSLCLSFPLVVHRYIFTLPFIQTRNLSASESWPLIQTGAFSANESIGFVKLRSITFRFVSTFLARPILNFLCHCCQDARLNERLRNSAERQVTFNEAIRKTIDEKDKKIRYAHLSAILQGQSLKTS